MDSMASLPYIEWLEDVLKEIVETNPRAISVEMVQEDNTTSTRYYNMTTFDRALVIATIQEAQIMDTIADNREAILEILSEEEEDDDDSPPDDTPCQAE